MWFPLENTQLVTKDSETKQREQGISSTAQQRESFKRFRAKQSPNKRVMRLGGILKAWEKLL